MTTGTKIRILGRALDTTDAPVWVIGADGTLIYLSAGTAAWLGRDVEPLIGRRCIAGVPVSPDDLDRIAASLSPPPGLASRGTASLKLQPPTISDIRVSPLDVRFIRIGTSANAITIAIGGSFDDRVADPEWNDAVALRNRLDSWRKRHSAITTLATAGVSSASRKLRRRLQVAAATRTDIAFFAAPGSGDEAIAARIHQLAAPGEPIVVVDGSLMDPELLDATLTPLIHRLTDSSSALGTALVRNLDEMPLDAQLRLAELHGTFGGRLRLIGLCGVRPKLHREAASDTIDANAWGEPSSHGLCEKLIEITSSLSVTVEPLSTRVEDIPLIATAVLDSRRAAGQGTAERLSRAALDAIVIYPWPHNFEELDASIRHAMRSATGTAISTENLPLAIRSYRPGGFAPQSARPFPTSLDEAVASYELRLIVEAVEAVDGNRAEAARRLGISRSRLIRKIDEAAKGSSDKGTDNGRDAK